MPLVDIKTTPEWYPQPGVEPRQPLPKPLFVRELRRAIPSILGKAWTRVGWGEFNASTCLPDIVPPYHADTANESDVSDIALTFKPNWTETRWEQRELMRRTLLEELDRWAKSVAEPVDRPSFDVDIDFTMGCGAYINLKGEVEAHWPDELEALYPASYE